PGTCDGLPPCRAGDACRDPSSERHDLCRYARIDRGPILCLPNRALALGPPQSGGPRKTEGVPLKTPTDTLSYTASVACSGQFICHRSKDTRRRSEERRVGKERRTR